MSIIISSAAEAESKYPKSGIWVLQDAGNTAVMQVHGANGLKTQFFWGDDQGAYDSADLIKKLHGFPYVFTGPFDTLPSAIDWAKTKPNAAKLLVSNSASKLPNVNVKLPISVNKLPNIHVAPISVKKLPNVSVAPVLHKYTSPINTGSGTAKYTPPINTGSGAASQTACQLKAELLGSGKAKLLQFEAKSAATLKKIRDLSIKETNFAKRSALNKLYEAYRSNSSSVESQWSSYSQFVDAYCAFAPNAPIPEQPRKLFHDSIEYLAATAECIENIIALG